MSVDLTRPDVIITHESDLDGFVAGILLRRLAKKLFDADVRLEAWNYNGFKNRSLNEKAGWITDFTFEARFDKPDWLVIDHHVTDVQPKNARLIHDVNKSAGLLCYELCKQCDMASPKLDRLVHLNNVADLFLEDDPDFAIASDYASLVKIYQFWNLNGLIDGELERLVDHPLLQVMEVKRRIEDPLGFAWSKKNVTEISPTVGYVETVVGNNNLIVHQLLEEKATKYPVLLTLMRKANNTVIASFRSRNGEALKVAEKLQGGGHANASGATLPKSVRNVDDAVNYLRQLLNPKAGSTPNPLNSMESLFASIEAEKK